MENVQVSNKAITSLYGLRAIFMCLIVLSHCANWITGITCGPFGRIGVVFFYLASGFVLMHQYSGKIAAQRFQFGNFILKRYVSILPLHWITLALYVVLVGVNFDRLNCVALPLNLLLLQSWIPLYPITFSFNGVSWFLTSIIFCYFIFPWCCRLLLKKRKVFCLLLLVLFLMSIILEMIWPDVNYGWLNKDTNLSYSPLSAVRHFMLGMLVYSCYVKNANKMNVSIIVPALLFLFLFILSQVELIYADNCFSVIISLLILSVVTLESQGRRKLEILTNPLMVYVGKISFCLYLIHGIVVPYLDLQGINNNSLNVFLVFVLSILIAIPIYHWVLPKTREMLRKILKTNLV